MSDLSTPLPVTARPGAAHWSARYGKPIVFVIVTMVLVGAYLALTIPVAVFPDTNFPRIVVGVDNGVFPIDQMLVTVTRPLEEAVNLVPGLDHLWSITSRGTAVHARIIAEIFKASAVVPAAAILPGEEGGTAVLVVTPDSIAHKRPVQLGVREGNKVQILNGVRPGEEVVIVGGLGLDDKAKVKIIDTTVKEADEDENPEPAPAKGDQKKDEAKPKAK